ncbi:MAG: adenosylcobinamide-phosphate synthase CbiB [Pseudomonadota bacterium]
MIATGAATVLVALLVEWRFGWPDWLYGAIRHPVVWIGTLAAWCERRFNVAHHSHAARYIAGVVSSIVIVALTVVVAWSLQHGTWRLLTNYLPSLLDDPLSASTFLGSTAQATAATIVTGTIASSLIAARSLHQHVADVHAPLSRGELHAARTAVAKVVGRDIDSLDEPAVARASIETLAESTCDGVVAPLFWGALLGLPGMAAYKAINTLDSMIGHRSERFHAFGGFAARLDDIANWVPARVTALLIVTVARKRRVAAWTSARREAANHRSPNAGWPEAATAGMLDVRLSGPRQYGGQTVNEPWIRPQAPDPYAKALATALERYRTSIEHVLVPTLAGITVLSVILGGAWWA